MNGEIIVDTFLTIGNIIVLLGIFEMVKMRWEYIKIEDSRGENWNMIEEFIILGKIILATLLYLLVFQTTINHKIAWLFNDKKNKKRSKK